MKCLLGQASKFEYNFQMNLQEDRVEMDDSWRLKVQAQVDRHVWFQWQLDMLHAVAGWWLEAQVAGSSGQACVVPVAAGHVACSGRIANKKLANEKKNGKILKQYASNTDSLSGGIVKQYHFQPPFLVVNHYAIVKNY